MRLAPLGNRAPKTVDEVFAFLPEHGDQAKGLAGGQNLSPAMSFRLAQPAVLVHVGCPPELAFIPMDDYDGGEAAAGLWCLWRSE